MAIQIHTAWFRKPDGEIFSYEVQTYTNDGLEDIKAAFVDNEHFIGVTSPDQTRDQNEAVLRKVSSPVAL